MNPTGSTPNERGRSADRISPQPDDVTVHLDSSYDSGKIRDEIADCGRYGQIVHKGGKASIQASQRWQVERANAWRNASYLRAAHCDAARSACRTECTALGARIAMSRVVGPLRRSGRTGAPVEQREDALGRLDVEVAGRLVAQQQAPPGH